MPIDGVKDLAHDVIAGPRCPTWVEIVLVLCHFRFVWCQEDNESDTISRSGC